MMHSSSFIRNLLWIDCLWYWCLLIIFSQETNMYIFISSEKRLHIQGPWWQCGPTVLAPHALRAAHLSQWGQDSQNMGHKDTQMLCHYKYERFGIFIYCFSFCSFSCQVPLLSFFLVFVGFFIDILILN